MYKFPQSHGNRNWAHTNPLTHIQIWELTSGERAPNFLLYYYIACFMRMCLIGREQPRVVSAAVCFVFFPPPHNSFFSALNWTLKTNFTGGTKFDGGGHQTNAKTDLRNHEKWTLSLNWKVNTLFFKVFLAKKQTKKMSRNRNKGRLSTTKSFTHFSSLFLILSQTLTTTVNSRAHTVFYSKPILSCI